MAMPYALDYSDAAGGSEWVADRRSGSSAAVVGGLYATLSDSDFASDLVLPPRAQSPSWTESLDRQLSEISEAVSSESWAFEPPNQHSIELARTMLEQLALNGVRPRHVGPSPEGGVSYLLLKGNKRGAIEVYNDGEHVLMLSDGSGIPFAWSFMGGNASREVAKVVASLLRSE